MLLLCPIHMSDCAVGSLAPNGESSWFQERAYARIGYTSAILTLHPCTYDIDIREGHRFIALAACSRNYYVVSIASLTQRNIDYYMRYRDSMLRWMSLYFPS